jgi:hypothetical protein
MKLLITILINLFLINNAISGLAQTGTIEGTVVSLDKDKVTLLVKGKRRVFDKNQIPSHFKLNQGSKIFVVVENKSKK